MLHTIKSYSWLSKISFMSSIVFRWRVLLESSGGVIEVFIQVALWRALYAGRTSVDGVALAEVISYFVLTSLVRSIHRIRAGERLAQGIHEGKIATDLLKPFRIKLAYVAQDIGEMAARIVFRTGPMFILVALLFHLQAPASFSALAAALIMLLAGYIINCYLLVTLSQLTFWLGDYWFLSHFTNTFARLFAGSFVPLWFYPGWLRWLTDVLPFRFTCFVPLSLYLGKTPLSEAPGLFISAAIWLIVLAGLERLVWRLGIRRIVIYGG